MKKLPIYFCWMILSAGLVFAGTGSEKSFKTDVILDVVPIKARSILAGRAVDALEKPPAEMPAAWTAVVFRIERVLSGDFETVIVKEPSLRDQMKKAAEEKQFWKFLIMDFKKNDEEGTPKGWLTMAVVDPHASFGIREGEAPSRQHYKISLARVHKDPASYVLVKSEKL